MAVRGCDGNRGLQVEPPAEFGVFENDAEERIHRNAAAALALRLGESRLDVWRLYEMVLRRLKREARVKDFLPVLVGRRVSSLIEKRSQMRSPSQVDERFDRELP